METLKLIGFAGTFAPIITILISIAWRSTRLQIRKELGN